MYNFNTNHLNFKASSVGKVVIYSKEIHCGRTSDCLFELP